MKQVMSVYTLQYQLKFYSKNSKATLHVPFKVLDEPIEEIKKIRTKET